MKHVYLLAGIAVILLAATYSAEATPLGAGNHAIHAVGHNRAAELAVEDFEIASSFEGTAAPSGHVYVILKARWKNILAPVMVSDADLHPDATMGAGGLGAGASASKKAGASKTHVVYEPYLIPDIGTQLQLLVNGESGAKLVNGNFKGKDLLSATSQQVAHGTEVAGRYVFEAATPITSLALAYFDKSYGDIRIPLAGSAPSANGKLIAGPVTSGALTLSVASVEEVAAIGGKAAPAGTHFVVVNLIGQGAASVGDNYLKVKPDNISRLIENEGYLYAPMTIDALDGAWNGVVTFVPGTPQRGKLVFAVPVQHGPLTLSVMVPGEAAPMCLPLSSAAAPLKLPTPVVTIPDGDTGIFYVYGSRRVQTFGTQKAGAGEEFLVLDVGIDNHTGSGMDFQTEEQILLLNGKTTIAATGDDLAATSRGLVEDGVVPAHTLGRYEIPFRIPAGASKFTVYYRGFEHEQKTELPTVR
ncbi:MAG: hypothetical protein ACRETC_07215 [Gammaproteobacteria bacterium]